MKKKYDAKKLKFIIIVTEGIYLVIKMLYRLFHATSCSMKIVCAVIFYMTLLQKVI